MILKPWREIAVPHEDVLKGKFQQAKLAADLARRYQNAALFSPRTFIAEGMRSLLNSVARHLTDRGGDPEHAAVRTPPIH